MFSKLEFTYDEEPKGQPKTNKPSFEDLRLIE